MIKYWIKNRLGFSLLLSVLLGVLCLFVFIKPNMDAHSYNFTLTSVYEKSEIDYDIPAPTKEQLNSIKELDFVDDVFGYYFTDSSVRIGSKNIRTKILFSDMLDSLSFTMYNSSRLIDSKEGLANPIYVDYYFATKNNVVLGDEIICEASAYIKDSSTHS